MRAWKPHDLQLGEGDDLIMLPGCDKWMHIAMSAIYQLAGVDPTAGGIYPQATAWVQKHVALVRATHLNPEAESVLFSLAHNWRLRQADGYWELFVESDLRSMRHETEERIDGLLLARYVESLPGSQPTELKLTPAGYQALVKSKE